MERSCNEYAQWSRRALLLTAASSIIGTRSLAQLVLNKQSANHTLVVVFLRGGMDGLSAVVPYREDSYYRLRPTVSIAKNELQDLDGHFGLNPSLNALFPAYAEGQLAVVHAVGSLDQSHSHFEAMNAMERGAATASEGEANGWLARYLNSTREKGGSPLRAISFSSVMPDSLRGGLGAISLESLADYKLAGDDSGQMKSMLRKLYSNGTDQMSVAGRNTVQVLDALESANAAQYRPANGADYPASDFSQSLKQVAFLIKNGFGVEVACLEKGGWDTHVAQGSTSGWLPNLFADLGSSLTAFRTDMKSHAKEITVVVMTEFGRRAYENSGLGTDHGSASAMFVMGDGIRGGRVHGRWPGLASAELEGPGDLEVTTDYRSVLIELLENRLQFSNAAELFSSPARSRVGLV